MAVGRGTGLARCAGTRVLHQEEVRAHGGGHEIPAAISTQPTRRSPRSHWTASVFQLGRDCWLLFALNWALDDTRMSAVPEGHCPQ